MVGMAPTPLALDHYEVQSPVRGSGVTGRKRDLSQHLNGRKSGDEEWIAKLLIRNA
jgi:hypothetical protein